MHKISIFTTWRTKMGTEQWVTMTEAAEALGITPTQVSRLAKKGAIRAEADALNQRVKLVELNEVRRVLETSKYYSRHVNR
jgi:predicted XRE-type DNA-binding protein